MRQLLRRIYKRLPFKRGFYFLLKKLWHPPESLYKHLHFEGIFTVKADKASFKMWHYGYFLENEVFWDGLEKGHEHVSYSLWKKLARDSIVIFDVGANTGIYSLIAESLNPDAVLFAFEPVKRVFEKLEYNRRLNNFGFESIQAALSNTDGEAFIYDTDAEHTYSVTVNKDNTLSTDNVIKTRIETIRLDTFIERRKLGRVDLMKIDVETHEPEVLEGMGRYLQRFKPTLLIEILDDECGLRVENIVKDLEYLYFNIDDKAGSVRAVEHISKSDFWNYLLCSPKTAKELGLTAYSA